MSSVSPIPSREVVVFDPEPPEGRKLEHSVEAGGYAPRATRSLDDCASELAAGRSAVGVLAFEALWPQPQEKLTQLKRRAPGARLVVVHSDDSPRLRLGHRLWAAGAIDFFVARSMSHSELGQVLRQAQADAALQSASEVTKPGEPSTQLRRLRELGAALANQCSVSGLVRELHFRLPAVIDYAALQVLVPEGEGFKLHALQTRPLAHQDVWGLVERTCEELSGRLDRPVTPEALVLDDSSPLRKLEASPPPSTEESWRSVVLPMMAPHGLAGCLSLLVPAEAHERAERDLELISYQLGAALGQARLLETTAQASMFDDLTGCYNRRHLAQLLSSEWKRSVRYSLQLSVALLDIDRFGQLNDVYGQVVGNEVLRRLAGFVREQLRETDHLARADGAKLVLVLPETGASEAARVLERIRLLAGSTPLYVSPKHGPIQVSMSGGIACFPASPVESPEALLAEAEQALSTAKRAGRDRVCVAAGPEHEPVRAEIVARPDGTADLRGFARIPARMHVRYLEIPDFESSLARVHTADISAGGVSLHGPKGQFKKNSYALLFVEDAQKAHLARVVWNAEEKEGGERAGLRFVTLAELDTLARRVLAAGGTHRALVVTHDSEVRLMVSRVLKATEYEPTFLDDAERWPEDLRLEGFELIVIGESALRGSLGQNLQKLYGEAGSVRIVVINESADRKRTLDAIVSHKLRHVVTGDESIDETLFATINKLLLGDYFGIRKYLLRGAHTRSWTLAYRDGKDSVLDGVKNLALEIGCHPRITELLVTAVDEMIMNALYRAPPEEGATVKPVTVECGSDGRLLAVSVMDEHGRLKPQDLYGGLGRALQYEQQAMPDETASASLGFKLMLDALTQVAINIEPGRATEIVGIVDLRKSLREYRSSSPAVNLFTKE